MVNRPLAEKPAQIDRKQLTTPKEADEYEAMIGHEYLKLDEKTHKPVDADTFYTPTHVFPRYMTSNPLENVAVFALLKWTWDKNQAGEPYKKNLGEEWCVARDFKKQFCESRVSVVDAGPVAA